MSWDSCVTNRLWPIINFCDENNSISFFWSNSKSIDLMGYIHFNFAMSWAMIDIINFFSKNFMVKRVWKWEWEYLIEDLQNLDLEVSWIDQGESFIEHIFQIFQITLIEWL